MNDLNKAHLERILGTLATAQKRAEEASHELASGDLERSLAYRVGFLEESIRGAVFSLRLLLEDEEEAEMAEERLWLL